MVNITKKTILHQLLYVYFYSYILVLQRKSHTGKPIVNLDHMPHPYLTCIPGIGAQDQIPITRNTHRSILLTVVSEFDAKQTCLNSLGQCTHKIHPNSTRLLIMIQSIICMHHLIYISLLINSFHVLMYVSLNCHFFPPLVPNGLRNPRLKPIHSYPLKGMFVFQIS